MESCREGGGWSAWEEMDAAWKVSQSEMWETSSAFSFPVPLYDLSRILTQSQNVRSFLFPLCPERWDPFSFPPARRGSFHPCHFVCLSVYLTALSLTMTNRLSDLFLYTTLYTSYCVTCIFVAMAVYIGLNASFIFSDVVYIHLFLMPFYNCLLFIFILPLPPCKCLTVFLFLIPSDSS